MKSIFDISQIDSRDHWLVYLIAGIVVFALLILLTILAHRIRFVLRQHRVDKFETSLLGLLSAAVNNPRKIQDYQVKIRQLLKKRWQYEMLLDSLTTMCYSFRGIYRARARALYEHFELGKLSEKKLASRKWDCQVEGIIELSMIGEKDAYKKILPLLDHKEWQVRKQSKIAIVELGKASGLVKMESKMGTMSRWTFLSVLSILHRSAFKVSKEQLEVLKNSKNPSTRRLAPYVEKYAAIQS